MTFKMNLHNLRGQMSISQNDFNNVQVKCIKFEVSIFISFEIIQKNKCDGVIEFMSDKASQKKASILKIYVFLGAELSELVCRIVSKFIGDFKGQFLKNLVP